MKGCNDPTSAAAYLAHARTYGTEGVFDAFVEDGFADRDPRDTAAVAAACRKDMTTAQKALVAHDLFYQGWLQREIADVLGVSRQRVDQLVREASWKPTRHACTETPIYLLANGSTMRVNQGLKRPSQTPKKPRSWAAAKNVYQGYYTCIACGSSDRFTAGTHRDEMWCRPCFEEDS